MAEKDAKNWDNLADGLIARDLKNDDGLINEIMFDRHKFDYLNLDPRILKGLARSGFSKLSFIQKEAIPLGRIGVDMVIQARSGAGKTCAYTCIIFDSLVPGESTQVLVVAPTREIAFQVAGVARAIGAFYENVKVCLVTGGFKVGKDAEELEKAQIVIGTPGRLIQLIELGHLNPSSIRLLVLDEADKLFDQLQQQMAALIARLPKSKQVIAVSATFRDDLKVRIEPYLTDPHVITDKNDGLFPTRNSQFYAIVPSKTNYALKLEVVKKWIDNLSFSQMIIFVNTKESGQKIANDFRSTDYSCAYLFGDLNQPDRFTIFKNFHGHRFNILVTTDLFSRGVDFKNVNMIINFDIPDCKETFLHRVGRAGRFGVDCLTLTLIESGPEELIYKRFEEQLKFEGKIMPEDLYRDSPWASLNERYRYIELTDYQRIDRAINYRRFQPPCRHFRPGPNDDVGDDPSFTVKPRRRVKPGRTSIRPPYYKKHRMYIPKSRLNPKYRDGREYLTKERCSLRELYPPECWDLPQEYWSSSEEDIEEEVMPPEGWPGCCGGHIIPGTNRWYSLDEEGNPIKHALDPVWKRQLLKQSSPSSPGTSASTSNNTPTEIVDSQKPQSNQN